MSTRTPAPNEVDPLTPRQLEVLEMIGRGRSNPEIADALGVTIDGAKWHVREILSKLGVESREEAAAYWRSQRRPAARLRRLLAPLALGKVGLGVAGGAVAVAIAVTATILLVWGDDESGTDASRLWPEFDVAAAVPASPGPAIATSDASFRLPLLDDQNRFIEAIVAYKQGFVVALLGPADPAYVLGWRRTYAFYDPATTSFTELWTPPADRAETLQSLTGDTAVLIAWEATERDPAGEPTGVVLRNLVTGAESRLQSPTTAPANVAYVLPSIATGGPALFVWIEDEVLPAGSGTRSNIKYTNLGSGNVVTVDSREPHDGEFVSGGKLRSPSAAGTRVAWVASHADRPDTVEVLDVATDDRRTIQADGRIHWAALSADGRYVAWDDEPFENIPEETGAIAGHGPWNGYVADLQTGAVTRFAVQGWNASVVWLSDRFLVIPGAFSEEPGSPRRRPTIVDAATGTVRTLNAELGEASASGHWLVWKEYAPNATGVEGPNLEESFAYFVDLTK